MGVDWEERVDYARLRKERAEKAQKELAASGMGAILCFDYNNIRYLTGHHFGEWGRDKRMFYAVLPKGGEPILFGTGERVGVTLKEAPWFTPKTHRQGFSWFVSSLLENIQPRVDAFVKDIKGIMKDHGVSDLPLGVDMGDTTLYNALNEAGIKLGEGYIPMLKARMIKTKDEIELMKLSAAIVDAAYDSVGRAIHPGVRECELIGIANNTMYSLGSDNVEAMNATSGPRTNPNHHDMSDRILRPGDLCFFDTIQAYNGYRTCYYRTFSVGRATKAQKESYRVSHDMMYDGIKKLKPGATTAEVASVWPDPEFWGLKDWSECAAYAVGHGLGLSIHEAPSISKPLLLWGGASPVKLEKGMVLALETWYGPHNGDHGVRLEEECVITDTGYEVITKFCNHSLPECMGGWYEHTNE